MLIFLWFNIYFQSSDDEPSEEKDRFVAQLYKFMDDRGKLLIFKFEKGNE